MDRNPYSLDPTSQKDSNPYTIANPRESVATAQAISSGAVPENLAIAKQQLGKKEYIGYCEAFVEQVTAGRHALAPSAVDAWNKSVDRGVARGDLNGIQPGDQLYFAPDNSNKGYGHVGIYSGDNKFISATDNGIEEKPLNQWINETAQTPVGYVPRMEALR